MHVDPLTLIVEFEIRSAEVDRDDWLEVWGRRATDAWEHEPETPAYGAAVPPDHSDRVLIFERYERGDESLASHMERSAHTALVEEMTARKMTRRRVSLAWIGEISDWGRWAPLGDDQTVAGLTLGVTGITFTDREAKDEFIKRTAPMAASLVAEDDDIKILGLGEVLRPDDRNPEPAVGDLVLVTVIGAPDHPALRSIEQHIDRGQTNVKRTYQTVDFGYLWKTLPAPSTLAQPPR